MNERIKLFEENLITIINNCNLPPSISYYILLSKTLLIKNVFDLQLYELLNNKKQEGIKENNE